MANESHSLTYYIIYWAVSALAVILTSKVIPGFKVSGFWAALAAAIVIGLVNTFIWPVLIFLTLPINLLTLGLFTFVINGAVIKIAAAFLSGFEVEGWLAAILGALVLSIVNALLHFILV
ncbi:MAG: phage holin family protein [Bdellovibrio sp.]|nr:phage holin family protein [Bdellovibrio sp.]